MTRACRLCGCTDQRACVTDGTSCHWVDVDLCSACMTAALIAPTPRDPVLVAALAIAWADFHRAPIWRLNVTRDALEAAATPLGWAVPFSLIGWCRTVLDQEKRR